MEVRIELPGVKLGLVEADGVRVVLIDLGLAEMMDEVCGRRRRELSLETLAEAEPIRAVRAMFRSWDISECLAYIRIPLAILQGADDQYGTIRQIEIAQEECYCPVEVTMIPGAGHSPHREAPEATLDAISEFAGRILDMHEGSQGRAA